MDNWIIRGSKTLGKAIFEFRKSAGFKSNNPDITTDSIVNTWFNDNRTKEKDALRNAWAFSAIAMIAAEVQAANLKIVEQSNVDGEPVEVINHPLEILINKPNNYMTRSLFWSYTVFWMKLQGNGYWLLVPDRLNQIKEIYPLPSNKVKAKGSDSEVISHYEYTNKQGQKVIIPREQICHLFNLANPFNPRSGLSELEASIMTTRMDNSMVDYNYRFFETDNVMPSAIINLKSGDSKVQIAQTDINRMIDELQESYQAVKRKTYITTAPGGIDVEALGYSARDMDFIKGREMNRREIFEVFGIPEGMTAVNATEANAKIAVERFKDNVYSRVLMPLQEQLTQFLAVPYFGENTKFVFDDIRITDRELKLQEMTHAEKVMTINELRTKYFDMEKIEGGDRLLTVGYLGSEMDNTNPGQPANNNRPMLDNKPSIPDNEDDETVKFNSSNDYKLLNSGGIKSDLAKFKRKAIRKLKEKLNDVDKYDGEISADTNFTSQFILDDEIEFIRTGLEFARTEQQVIDVFNSYEMDNTKTWRPWSKFETRLQIAMAALLERMRQSLLNELSILPENVLNRDLFWNNYRDEIKEILKENLELAITEAVYDVHETLDIGLSIDWGGVNSRVLDYVESYTGPQSDLITDNLKRVTRDVIVETIQEGGQAQQIIDKLLSKNLYTRSQAERIAVTEVTTIYAKGINIALTEAGYEAAIYEPAAHVNCRCGIRPHKKGDQRFIIWQTARDELVCQRDLSNSTNPPPSEFKNLPDGCRGLHNVILSSSKAGNYIYDI